MENQNQGTPYQEPINQPNNQQLWQQQLPNSSTVLVLGIISILTSLWFGFIGLILGIIALVMASGANKMYLSNPAIYTQSSYINLKAGKICAIIGTCLSAVYLLFIIMFISFIATFFANMPWNFDGH
jgi:membrane protein required for beta-lactamase induction